LVDARFDAFDLRILHGCEEGRKTHTLEASGTTAVTLNRVKVIYEESAIGVEVHLIDSTDLILKFTLSSLLIISNFL